MVLHEFVRDRLMEPEVAHTITSWNKEHSHQYPKNTNQMDQQNDITREIADYFENRGWNVLGRGVFSVVLDKPNTNFVIKVSATNDKGFNKFVLLTHKSNNPHFPKITNLRRMSIDGRVFFIYLIEKLENVSYKMHPLLHTLKYLAKGYSLEKSLPLFRPETCAEIKKYLDEHPELVEACNQVYENNSTINTKSITRVDLHSHNFMQRKDGTIVITDPLVDVNWEG